MTFIRVDRYRVARSHFMEGRGFIGGSLPETSTQDAADGRAKKMNVPGRVRISVYERKTMKIVDSTISESDGSWRIAGLNPNYVFVVIGFDDRGQVNAAIQDWVKPHDPEL